MIAYQDDSITLHQGDCIEVMAAMPDNSVDSIVTDPPYGLEFMGKGWDAPWRDKVSDVNADAGIRATGYSDGGQRLARPSFTGSTNPKCSVCKGTRRGRRDGTAKVAVCLCADGGSFPNVRAIEMQAFGAWCEQWVTECLRVLKPGGHLLAFGGTRTWHRLTVAIEDAGFEIRDSIAWLYGSGFPKSHNVSKAIESYEQHGKSNSRSLRQTEQDGSGAVYTMTGKNNGIMGATRIYERKEFAPTTEAALEWGGWGTALKPGHEPIVVARKPLAGTIAANVLEHGTGALNIDACRVPTTDKLGGGHSSAGQQMSGGWKRPWMDDPEKVAANAERSRASVARPESLGRWPANVVLDEDQAVALDQQAPGTKEGGASRFFYVAKAPKSERPVVDGVAHPTVKPVALMRWLVRLVTPPNGVVLDPFVGSGATVEAAMREGFQCLAIEREAEYLPLVMARIERESKRKQGVGDSGGIEVERRA